MYAIHLSNFKLYLIFLRFFSRETGKLIFRLYITKPNGIRLGSRTVQLTFHPTEPFAISYVKEPSQCFTNFHLRKVYMPE